jgi:chromosomal replication initiation ATPase DnaA
MNTLTDEHTARAALFRAIVIKVAQGSRWSTPEITGTRRTASLVRLRHLAMYLCRTLVPASTLQEIAAHFGKKNHVTVSHACEQMKQEIASDETFAKWVLELTASLVKEES